MSDRKELLEKGLKDCLSLFDEAENVLKKNYFPSVKKEDPSYNLSSVISSALSDDNEEISVERSTFTQLNDLVNNCNLCNVADKRKNILFGEGPIPARLMVIGEGPGKDEDSTGRLFVGRSGQFLSRWLTAISLNIRKDVYLSNVIKCFSGTNPSKTEVAHCIKYLERQIQFVKPEAILVLGKVAANGLFKTDLPLNQYRGKILRYDNIPVIVTYHPAAVLRNPEWKRPVWEDIKKIATILNLVIPSHSRR